MHSEPRGRFLGLLPARFSLASKVHTCGHQTRVARPRRPSKIRHQVGMTCASPCWSRGEAFERLRLREDLALGFVNGFRFTASNPLERFQTLVKAATSLDNGPRPQSDGNQHTEVSHGQVRHPFHIKHLGRACSAWPRVAVQAPSVAWMPSCGR